MATKRQQRELLAEYSRKDQEWGLFEEFEIAFCNAVKIDGLEKGVYQPFILRGLLFDGAVGYVDADQSFKLGINPGWYWTRPTGFNSEYGFPKSYNLTYGNYEIAKSNVFYQDFHLIHANATHYPYAMRFLREAKELTALSVSEKINTEASRNADLIPVPDPTIEQSLKRAYDNMRNGCATVVLSEREAECLQNKVTNPTPFIADKIHALYQARYADALKRCGIVSANDYKRERVQTAEVDASVGETIDYINILIDSVNDSFENEGLPFIMYFNGYAARYDEDNDGKVTPEDFENEEKEEKEDDNV